MSFWKKCPLLAAVIVSGLVIEGAGVANGVKSGEIENPASWKQPALATVFIDLKQGVYPWSDRSVQTAAMDAADVQKDRITEETGGQANEGNGGEKAGQMANADRDADHKNGTGDENEAGVSGNAMPGKAAEEKQEAESEPYQHFWRAGTTVCIRWALGAVLHHQDMRSLPHSRFSAHRS